MDIEYLLVLQNLRNALGEPFAAFMRWVTTLGQFEIILPIAACIIWCGHKEIGYKVLYVSTLGAVVNGFLKITACVSRPWLRDPRVMPDAATLPVATGYSFPSGHVSNAITSYGTLAVVFRKYKSVAISLWAVILAVCFSRNFLGVHTPQDVFFSTLISIVLIAGGWFFFDCANKNDKSALVFVLTNLAIAAIVVVYANVKTYPPTFADGTPTNVPAMAADIFKSAGAVFGALVGWFLEKKLVRFSVPENRMWLIRRCAAGIIFYQAANMLAAYALSGANAAFANFAGAAWALLVLTFVYPAMFTGFGYKGASKNNAI
jgi:membrane-associated phospholipid phosphatase